MTFDVGDARKTLMSGNPISVRHALAFACDEIEALRELQRSIADRVLPGEVDSVDALRQIVTERDQLRAEIERLRDYNKRLLKVLSAEGGG